MKKMSTYLILTVFLTGLGYAAYDYAVNDRGFSAVHGKTSAGAGIDKGHLGVTHSWMNR